MCVYVCLYTVPIHIVALDVKQKERIKFLGHKALLLLLVLLLSVIFQAFSTYSKFMLCIKGRTHKRRQRVHIHTQPFEIKAERIQFDDNNHL